MEIYSCRAREDGTLSFRLDMSVICLEDDDWFEWKQLSDYALIGYGLGIRIHSFTPSDTLKGIFGWSLDNDEFLGESMVVFYSTTEGMPSFSNR